MYRFCYRLLLAAFITLLGLPLIHQAISQQPKSASKHVRLVIDYGDGVEKHFTAIAWKHEMTVLDAMIAARKHPRGIKFVHRGSGKTAFLTKIDDLENEGRGSNWIYRVNGKLANQSFAVFPVKPADTILWEFGEYR
jgi:hypothetical protein